MKYEVSIRPLYGGHYRTEVWCTTEVARRIAEGEHETRTLWGAKRWAKRVAKKDAKFRKTKTLEYTIEIN